MTVPELTEARIQTRIAELRVLVARTALDWERASARERFANSDNPLLRALARRMPPLPPPLVD
jgi:hypothetical protein